jgi:hypothetical protein
MYYCGKSNRNKTALLFKSCPTGSECDVKSFGSIKNLKQLFTISALNRSAVLKIFELSAQAVRSRGGPLLKLIVFSRQFFNENILAPNFFKKVQKFVLILFY